MDQVDEAVTGPGTLVQVLGPVTATVRGRPCLISSPMQRAVLSLLAVDAGRVVSVDRLISELWGETPPDSATSTLQVYISRLRRSLGDVPGDDPTSIPPVRIRLRPPGYLLELPDGALDVWRLTRAVEAAHAQVTSDPQGALVLLDHGLSLVTGEPMVDVVDALGPVAAAEAQRLSELVLQAREARLEALLGVGRASEAAAAAAPSRPRPSAPREPARPAAAGAVPQRTADRGLGGLPGAARTTGRRSGSGPRSGSAASARSAVAAGLEPGLPSVRLRRPMRSCLVHRRCTLRSVFPSPATTCWAGSGSSPCSSRQ